MIFTPFAISPPFLSVQHTAEGKKLACGVNYISRCMNLSGILVQYFKNNLVIRLLTNSLITINFATPLSGQWVGVNRAFIFFCAFLLLQKHFQAIQTLSIWTFDIILRFDC